MNEWYGSPHTEILEFLLKVISMSRIRGTQKISLCAKAGILPFQLRFLFLTANYLASTAQFPQIPIFLPSFCPQNSLRLSLKSQQNKHLRFELLSLLGHVFYQLFASTRLPYRNPPINHQSPHH